MANQRRIGVFGGSFDPVHTGHMIVAEILHHSLDLDVTLFMPARLPPHKPNRALLPARHRLAMLERSLDGVPYFQISRIDIDRPGKSFTADSLQALAAQYSIDKQLVFLMGQDSLKQFPTWYHPERIAALATLGVAYRPGVEVDLGDLESAVPALAGRVQLVPIPLIEISSSDIRRRVREAKPYRFQVLPRVADYIAEHGLYSNRHENPPQNRPKS